MSNALASQLCNIQNDHTATERQKVQACNTQKALETLISFLRFVATVTAPEGEDQLLRRKDRKRERIRGTHAPSYTTNESFAPCVTNEVSNR